MFKKVRTAVFGILILAIVFVLCLQRWSAGSKNIGSTLLLPVSAVANWVRDSGSGIMGWFSMHNGLLQENSLLKRESQTNQLALVRLQELEAENVRLRQALQFQQSNPWKLKLARVVGRDPSNWWRMILIGAGSRDGLKPNQAVLATVGEAALVGRVLEVGTFESRVVLVGDPNCLVSVVVGETRNSGVVQPLSATTQDPTLVKLSYLSGNGELLPGYRLYTSGMGGVFPAGIYVGTITDSVNMEHGHYKEATVRLAADANLLEEVWVVVQ